MNNSMFNPIESRILECQSPIIHFQSYEKGATLRASEVKPKLDKFILKRFGKKDSWLISEDHTALNYKLQFFPYGEQTVSQPHKIYYGNLKNPEPALCVKGDCTMKIICFIPDLMETIKQCLNDFFICTNFGRMQSKGFGSYIVKGTSTNQQNISKALVNHFGIGVCYKIEGYTNTNAMFSDIQKMYSVMKSGYNGLDYENPDKYHRSYLFEYCYEELGIGNEKAELKQSGLLPCVKHPNNKRTHRNDDKINDNYPAKYVRAMLGVGEQISYITGFDPVTNKPGRRSTVSIKSDDIKRFSSPIRFKIIKNAIYFFATKIPSEMYNKKFIFVNKLKKDSKLIFTPKYFDAEAFLGWFVNKYKNAKGNGTYGLNKDITIAYQNNMNGEIK